MAEIKDLENSLIYQMSLGSRELYHSNVWAWLMKKDPRYINIFFSKYNGDISELDGDIIREGKHFDLSFKTKIKYSKNTDKDDFYVIENKIKSLPNIEQLERYNKTIEDFGGKYNCIHKVLVILINLYNDIEKTQIQDLGWTIIEYKDVAERIQNNIILGYIDKFGETNAKIVEDYATQISITYSIINDKLNDKASRNKFTYKTDLNLGNTLIRLDDVYKKLKGWDAYNYVKVRLDNDSELQNLLEDYELYINQSFNNKKVTLDFRWAHKDELHDKNGWNGKRVIGIQIEELDYRFVYGVPADKQDNNKIGKADNVFAELSGSKYNWFDETYDKHIGKLHVAENEYPTSLKVTKNKLYNKYLGDQVFLYQYYNLPGKDKGSPLSYEDLYEKIKSDLIRAADILNKMPPVY